MAWTFGTEGLLEFAVVAVASITAVMNPASTTAVYTILTRDMRAAGRREVIRRSIRISAIVLLFFAFTGQLIFSIFDITLPAFRIAGGILLVTVANGMLGSRKVTYSPEDLENMAVVPLAFPLTCGAGTITTVILLSSPAGNLARLAAVILAIGVALGISSAGMRYGPEIFRFIGEEGLNVVPKLMAIIVLALAVQFIISGVGEAMPQILGAA
ncbi:MAG: MarC family protein [Methanomicrobiaceae archaeon]|nr:MarC family protein [Methanomicrobiaceae archaeon]